jgi:formylglycine-generating enzyme required for sulfatase activity
MIAVEPPPAPAGMLAVGGGTLLPGLAEAQLQLAITQCEQDYQRHEQLAAQCSSKFDKEPPRSPVTVPAFYIDRFEVSQAAWADCRTGGPCNRLLLHWELKEQPATGVTHEMASGYCEWRGARLPTENEWLMAARGNADPRLYPWGDTPPQEGERHKANLGKMGSKRGIPDRDDGHKYAAPIGIFLERGQSATGVANLAGNVREWTASREGDGFVVLGGGWRDVPHDLRVTRRQRTRAAFSQNDLGFRCAKDVSGE